MPVDPFGASSASGGGVSRGFVSGGPADVYDPYVSLNRGGGNPAYFGVSDGNTQKRQFATVGKANLNLLDPLSQSRAQREIVPIDAPDEGPLGGIGRYYSPSTPGGLFAGLIGAGLQTLGGVFGQEGAQTGAQIGQTIGKTIEAPLSIVGGLGLDSIPFVAPIIDQANANIEEHSPYILRDTAKIPTNIGGMFQSLLNTMGLVGRAVERTYAGMSGQRGALPEDIQARIDSGELTHDQALDELVMSGRSYSNDPIHSMVFSMLFDPVNWASLGVGAVSGAVRGTTSIARAFGAAATREGGVVARMAGQAGEVGDLVRAAQAGENLVSRNFSRGALGEMRSGINRDLAERVAGGEDIPDHMKLALTERLGMSALGPVTDEATRNIVYRTAAWAARVTDPVNFFTGNKAGERSMEQLHMASATGVIAAIKAPVVRRITGIADGLASDGGDRIMEALGTWGGNAMQEVASHDSAKAAAQLDAVPQVGSFTQTEANRQVLASGGYDTNIGKVVEIHVEQTKDIRVASLPPEQMMQETARKLASILGVDVSKVVAAFGGKVTADEAIAVHGMYYYTKGKRFHTDVVARLKEGIQQGSLAPLVKRTKMSPDHTMMVTPRTLTDKKLASSGLEAALKTGNVTEVRAITSGFDRFDWLTANSVKDKEVIDAVTEYLSANKKHLPREIELIDPNTGRLYTDLGPDLTEWAQDGADLGYGLAHGLPENAPIDAQLRVSKKANGTIRNIDPWLDFWAEGIPAAKRLSRWQATRLSMFRGIRGERIWWNQRRRFITDMSTAKGPGHVPLPPALADRLFRALMSEASAGHLLPRGMAPDQMMDAVAGVLRDARDHNSSWGGYAGKLTDRQVVLGFLKAMEGDTSLVGVTQKITGRIKSGAPGASANYWGQISEKLYPLMRFTLNPVFMAMEFTEPYILNIMRGVPLPLRRNQERYEEGLASANASRQFIFASQDPDGLLAESMEMNALRIGQFSTARQQFGPRTMWGKLRGSRPEIAQRKAAAYGLQYRQLVGEGLYAAFKAIKGDQFDAFWGRLELDYGTTSRAAIADRWVATNLGLMDHNGHLVNLSMDLMNPQNIGSRIRFSTDGSRPGDFTFGDVEHLLDGAEENRPGGSGVLRKDRGLEPGQALLDDLRSMTLAEFLGEVERSGTVPRIGRISHSAAADIWNMANGPEVEPFWKEYRKVFLRTLKSATGFAPETRKLREAAVDDARAFVRAAAEGRRLTEAEFIAKHFDEVPQWALDAGTLPPEVLTDIRRHIGHSITRRQVSTVSPATIVSYPSLEKSGALADLSHPIQEQVAQLREGFDDTTRPYVYIGTKADRLETALGQGMDQEGLLATRYATVHTDPLRAATRSKQQRLVRIKREDVMATRDNASSLKKPKSHDMTLDEDIYAADYAKRMEVFTSEGWMPWEQYKAERLGLNDAGTPNLYPDERAGLVGGEPWYQHIFGTDETKTETFALEFDDFLTPQERRAVTDYTGFYYRIINAHLRGVLTEDDWAGSGVRLSDARIEELTAHLDASLKKGVVRKRMTLYRGIDITDAYEEYGADLGYYFDVKVGEHLPADPGFTSTSKTTDTAQGFAGHRHADSSHRSALVTLDIPPGTNALVVEGIENEWTLGRNIPWEVTERKVVTKANGAQQVQLKVRPTADAEQMGTKRLMMGDPPTAERNAAMAKQLAATDPERLRQLAVSSPIMVRAGVMARAEEAIAAAEAARPSQVVEFGGRKFGPITPEQSLAEVVEHVPDGEMPAYHAAWADTRDRITKLSETSPGPLSDDAHISDDADMRLMASFAAAAPEKGGRSAITLALGTLERLWQRGGKGMRQGINERLDNLGLLVTQHILRGVDNPIETPRLPAAINDSTDVFLGNDNRRHIGRTDLSQPIVADDAAYEGAGYMTQEVMDDLARQGHDVTTTDAPVVFNPAEDHAAMSIPGNDVEVGAPLGPTSHGSFAEPPPEGITTAGVAIQEADGRVWIYEPAGHYGGYEHSWPKGRPDPGESLRDAAIREAQEEMGFSVELTGHLGDFTNVQGTSRARIYTARRTGGGPSLAGPEETATIKLVSPERAKNLLIHDDVPDTRDQAILDALNPPVPATPPIPTGPLEPTGAYLGGTTGPRQMRDPATGLLYVEKRGANPGHIAEEFAADKVYEAMGVPVAKAEMVGGVKRAEFIDGGETLTDFWEHATDAEKEAMRTKLGEHFALDALLANWDVVGLEGDNIIIKNGIPYRIDNGGALRYRAQGAPKSTNGPKVSLTAPSGGEWGPDVTELRTMADDGNDWQWRMFAGIPEGEVRRQVLALDAQRRVLLDALPADLRVIVSQRLDSMLDQTAGVRPTELPAQAAAAAPVAAAAPGALVPVVKTEETHAYLVNHYNEMARLANEQGLGGYKDWKAADMPLLAKAARERLGRTPTELPAQAIDRNLQDVLAEVYFPKGSEGAKYNAVLDLLNRPENRAARHQFMSGVQTNLIQQVRDELGLIVDDIDDSGVGIWDRDTPQPMVPLHLVSTARRGNDLADVLAYVMQQREVWHFTVADTDELDRLATWGQHEVRVSITFDALPSGVHIDDVAQSLGERLDWAKGATAVQHPNGQWQLTIIDRDGKAPRLNGKADKERMQGIFDDIDLGEHGDISPSGDIVVDYGKTYVAGPDIVNGEPDWKGHRDKTVAALQGRGSPADGDSLDGLRSSYLDNVKYNLRDVAPVNTGRAEVGDAVSGVLEDNRGGTTFGTTTPVGASRAVVRGFGNTDAQAGIHELIHVFSIAGADPSLKAAIVREYEQRITDSTVAIAQLRARAAAHPNASVRSRWNNEATAMEAGLQTPNPGEWGPQHEEFFVELVKRWIDNGNVPSPELNNAFNHFRNWTQMQQTFRTKHGMPPIEVSREMKGRLDRMFSRPGIETVPYSIEQEVDRQAARQVVRQASDEAHATQYYKKDRSMFERSLNHPYIGLYPASYMWGKILPEMVRFLALRPFGMTTPFLGLNVAREVSDSFRTQSETDPSFKKFLADNEDAFMFMSMFFPALPQDIPANVSLPLRRVAEQGLESQQAIAQGGEAKDIEFAKGAQDAIQYAVGPLGTIRTAGDITGMGGDLIRSTLGIKTSDDVTREPLPLR